MIQRILPRKAAGRHSTRARRASRILLAVTAMGALLSLDLPEAGAATPLGVTAEAPASAESGRVGALFAGGLDGGHFCTASVVRSLGHDLIATAAHCLEHPDTTVFAPGYRDGDAPYGLWRLTRVYVAPAWTAGQDPDADVAFATVTPADSGETRSVEDVVGSFPVAAAQPSDVTVTVLGYPSVLDAPLACSNATSLFSPTQRRIDCPDLSGGTSGSPWLAGGSLAGVLGGYQGGGNVPEVSYSAVMGDEAMALYCEAAGVAR
ncbi:serine protease [Streptomyces sp. NPDC089915]|uniref:trypsin-like serine peptidase n=1 Tax=Streptomyces sp. NPDC089915 TaxID=3155186 RepID=UPI003415577B